MPLDAEARKRRARLGANARHHPDRPDLSEADRRVFKASAAERYIRDLVDTWPPLTAEQRGRLAALLAGAGEADASPAPE
jgi:hypothetical protein